MTISIDEIKKLRDSTGVSMTSCKKALEESNGDMDLAFDVLRKKGESKAAERSERSTSNGSVGVKILNDRGVFVALLCETDFVARGDDFKGLLNSLLEKAINGELKSENDEVLEVKDAQLKMGENVKMGKVAEIKAPILGSYIHTNNKIGCLVGLEGGDEELAKDIAMHATATSPKYLKPEEIDSSVIDKEKVIWTEQLKGEGKNEEIISKILFGKEKKFREENSLLKQQFVKNPEITIESLLATKNAKILNFVVYSI